MDNGLESEGKRLIWFGCTGKASLKRTLELKLGWWEEPVVQRSGPGPSRQKKEQMQKPWCGFWGWGQCKEQIERAGPGCAGLKVMSLDFLLSVAQGLLTEKWRQQMALIAPWTVGCKGRGRVRAGRRWKPWPGSLLGVQWDVRWGTYFGCRSNRTSYYLEAGAEDMRGIHSVYSSRN